MTPAQLLKRKRYWQKVLGLEHWSVCVHAVLDETLDGEGTFGRLVVNGTTLEADVYVALGGERTDEQGERTLRHELLHLLLHDLTVEHRQVCECLGTEAQELARRRWLAVDERAVEHLNRMLDVVCPAGGA